jgi:TonB-dependent receptor
MQASPFSPASPRPLSVARSFRAAFFLPFRRLLPALGCALLLAAAPGRPALRAQSATGTGAIEGRVTHAVTGAALENVRVSRKGTATVTLTDVGGRYRLADLPAGPVVLRFLYSGLEERETTVAVAPGSILQQDVALAGAATGPRDTTVQLDTFVVQSTKETNAANLAVNTQRSARNIVSVVAADEFGTLLDNNPGELLKNLPGMDVEYFGGTIVAVSVRGLSPDDTEINFDGMPSASANVQGSNAGVGSLSRSFEVQHMSAADIARVEVRKVPLPEDSANSVGGSVNMIRRSAFEKSRREIDYMASFVSDGDYLTTRRIDGPGDKLRARWRPNLRVTWTEPLSKDLGFAFTAGRMDQITNVRWSSGSWNTGSAANYAAHQSLLAANQPLTPVPSLFNPALSQVALSNAPYSRAQNYASLRADWRPRRELTLGWSLGYTDAFKGEIEETRFRLNAAAVGTGAAVRANDATQSLGRVGGGAVRQESAKWRNHYQPTFTTAFSGEWRQDRLQLSAKASFAKSTHRYRDIEDGFFETTSAFGTTDGGLAPIGQLGFGGDTANPIPLTIDFFNPGYYITAGRIDVRTTPGRIPSTNLADYTVPVDWRDPSLYRIGGVSSRPGKATGITSAVKLAAQYAFTGRHPLRLKIGADAQEEFRKRDYAYTQWRYVGADGIPNSPDDNAAAIVYRSAGPRPDPDYGHVTPPRFSMSRLYDLYVANPSWFVVDQERTVASTLRTSRSSESTETTVSPFAQFDLSLFHGRLRMTGGVRRETLEFEGRSLLTNRSNAYLKYADGSTVRLNDRDAAGNPLVVNRGTANVVDYRLAQGPAVLPVARAGAPILTPEIQAAGNALRAAGLTTNTGTNLGIGTVAYTNAVYRRLGARGEGDFARNFPSLHATWSLTENLDLQVAYAQTTTRPSLANVVMPSDDISDDLVTVNGVQALGRITLTNPDLKPMDSDTIDIRLAYYTRNGGSWAIGVYRKDFANFTAQIDTDPLTPDDLRALQAQYPEKDLSDELVGYSLRTQRNVGSSRLDGAELEGRQTLDPFLPSWAKGFRVGGSMAYANRIGANQGNLGKNRKWRGAANLTYSARKYTAAIKYQMNGDWIENDRTTDGNAPGATGRQVILRQDVIDLEASYRFRPWAEIFVSAGNVTNALRIREVRYAGRPIVGSVTSSSTLGKAYALGLKGRF